MKQKFVKFQNRLGKAYVPLLLIVFAVVLFGLMFSSVRQKDMNLHEGQVADETIRANKTIENTEETEQKRKLAAEAVAPEYTYQEDLADEQHQRIEKLFAMITTANQKTDKDYNDKVAKAKEGESIPQPTTADRIATLKSQFETLDQETVSFYQGFPSQFYQLVFGLTEAQLDSVETESLKLIDAVMIEHVRTTNIDELKQNSKDDVQFLNISTEMQQVVDYLIDHGVVVNDVYNEKKTNELKQTAKNDVQPVMIYQGEVIVREGSQIDQKALIKMDLLGMTNQNTTISPIIALGMAIVLQLLVLLYFVQQTTLEQQKRTFLIFYVFTMSVGILVMKFFQLFQTEQLSYIPLLFPAAFVPLVLSCFVNRRTGIISAIFQVIFSLFVFYDGVGTSYLTILLVSYMFEGTFATVIKRKRISEQLTPAIFWLILFPVLLSMVLVTYQGVQLSDPRFWSTILCVLAGCIISFLMSMGLHPYIELLVSDDSMIVLNELSNPNHPLLKQLLEEAPGTYHHSMMVANLSANAVAEIGGRSLLTRVACYYHDIGKVKHANFFVENLPDGAENPHNFLLPEDSRQIIFGHVIDGAKILEENHMPQMVVDICRQHHGTTLMRYFYVRAQERNPEVKEADFRYPGPKPQTKEAGIVNIADSCEAAVRAMNHPTNDKIKEFVHDLVQSRLEDGQLDECGLTMKEIRIVEKSMINGLCSTFHSRIKYPKMKSEAEKMKEEQEKRDE